MSNFPQNLSILRRKAGYTQESLAEALDVSRQAVSKWESGQTLPEAATLLQLADLLHCSLDELMRETLSEETLSPTEEPAADEGQALYAAWSAHVDRFAAMIALGVSLILLGAAGMLLVSAFFGEDEPFIILPFFLCLIAAVFLFVSEGLAHANFQKAYPKMPDCCDPADRERFQHTFRMGIAGAIAGILVDVTIVAVMDEIFPGVRVENFMAAGFLAILALCVGLIVYLGILTEKYELEKYNVQRRGPDIEGAIMLTAAGIYLFLGFTRELWHPGWVVFPIGGILCAIINSLRRK